MLQFNRILNKPTLGQLELIYSELSAVRYQRASSHLLWWRWSIIVFMCLNFHSQPLAVGRHGGSGLCDERWAGLLVRWMRRLFASLIHSRRSRTWRRLHKSCISLSMPASRWRVLRTRSSWRLMLSPWTCYTMFTIYKSPNTTRRYSQDTKIQTELLISSLL